MSGIDVDSGSDAASQQQDEDWDDWGQSGEDADDDMARSLFDSTVFPSVEQALAHDAAVHQFDLRAYLTEVPHWLLIVHHTNTNTAHRLAVTNTMSFGWSISSEAW